MSASPPQWRALSKAGKLDADDAAALEARIGYTTELGDLGGANDIDEGMRLGCGHPMGPVTLCDFIGLDVLYAVCDSLFDEFKRPEYAPPPLLKRMVVAGHHGRKTGRGFYEYAAARQPVAA